MNKIEEIIQNKQGGTVLFLGRVTNFTVEELSNFLEVQGMSYADKYIGQDDIALLVLSSMMTPLEEDLSYELYDAKVPDVTLKDFEAFYTTHIKPNTLLMSLKLSNDQERLLRLLKNEAFLDDVYLKLFKMYDWNGEGVHENNNNRDITISFVKRFYRPDGFRDPAMIYAPTTVVNIAQESNNFEVLDAILTMPNHEIKVSRYETNRPKNLRETVAFNEALSLEAIKRLLSYQDKSIDYFLCSNPTLRESDLELLYGRVDRDSKLMLTQNSKLSDRLFEKLLWDGDEVVKSLLSYQEMSEYRLGLVEDSEFIAYLGQNETITNIITNLIELNSRELDFQLASNSVVNFEILEKLYEKYADEILFMMAHNPNLSTEFFLMLHKKNEYNIDEALATNHSTPKEILSTLCERKDRELNRLLASNPSVNIKYLREFQLDTSLIRILANNETYGNSVLQGLGI